MQPPTVPSPFPDPTETLEVPVSLLKTLLDYSRAGHGSPPFRLVDCREDDEFDLCRIEGATLLPLSRFPDIIEPLLAEPGLATIVYCHHGMRSAQAAAFLRHRGLPLTYSLAGGIDAWSREVDPSTPRY